MFHIGCVNSSFIVYMYYPANFVFICWSLVYILGIVNLSAVNSKCSHISNFVPIVNDKSMLF